MSVNAIYLIVFKCNICSLFEVGACDGRIRLFVCLCVFFVYILFVCLFICFVVVFLFFLIFRL